MIPRPGLRTRTLTHGSQVMSSGPKVIWGRAGIKPWVMLTLAYTLKHSTPVCLLNGFLGTFAHWKFSPDTLSLINQHCTLETKAYKVESTWIQSLALFCKHVLWPVVWTVCALDICLFGQKWTFCPGRQLSTAQLVPKPDVEALAFQSAENRGGSPSSGRSRGGQAGPFSYLLRGAATLNCFW